MPYAVIKSAIEHREEPRRAPPEGSLPGGPPPYWKLNTHIVPRRSSPSTYGLKGVPTLDGRLSRSAAVRRQLRYCVRFPLV